MKKIGLCLLAAISAITLSSCNESDGDFATSMDFVTVHTVPVGDDYYFTSDQGNSVYPSDKSRVGAYKAEEGKRAIIAFSLLNKIDGYDHNIKLYGISTLYTGKIRNVTTQEELDKVKDDPISLDHNSSSKRLSKEHLTLGVLYPVNDNSKHKFEIIVNSVQPSTTYEGYLDVELRHDAGGETQGGTSGYYISFSLAEIKPLLEGMKGITVRVREGSSIQRTKIDWLKTN